MNYTLHQLHVFLTISRTGSITKSAEELHLTQPAVSIQLKNFQDQFEMPLTEVVGRKLYITDFGKEIAAAAEKILEEANAINYISSAYGNLLAGRLKISVVSTGKYIMPYLLSDFMKEHVGVDLLMDVTNKSSVIKSLENNEVDFALVSVMPGGISLEHMPLMYNQLYVVANTELASQYDINTWEDLTNIPLIYREQGSGTRQVMEQFFKANNIAVEKKMELTTNEAVKQAVLAGLGCSIMPVIGLKNELNDGLLKILPVEGFPIQSTWHLIWLKKKRLTSVATAFLQLIQKEKDAIIKEQFGWIDEYVAKSIKGKS
ncbi:LysR family transcriptional regulator [Algivirga pacifica]|uniref:LysR family transcriptional regulator n=1 Tax=Algivirga pacifica TaxID=1162670 RepID=A0ABP9DAU5_9BACT